LTAPLGVLESSHRRSRGRVDRRWQRARGWIAEHHHNVVGPAVIEHRDAIRIDRRSIDVDGPDTAASMFRIDD
jgi:hypothetical protein